MKKASDLRSMTIEELQQEVVNLQKGLFNLRFQKTTGEIENPMNIKYTRRDIARVLTVIAEKTKQK